MQKFITILERAGFPPPEYISGGISERKTKIFITPYEKTALIIHRANQLATGGIPLIPYDEKKFDPGSIAREEVNLRLLPNLIVRRILPNGEFEDIPSNELILC